MDGVGASVIVADNPSTDGRRLHSFVSAAREPGLTAPVVDAILTAAGVFHPDDPDAHNRKIFSADTRADLLEEMPTWVGPGEMMAGMAITKRAFDSLEEAGVLTPPTKAPEVIARWHLSDGRHSPATQVAARNPNFCRKVGIAMSNDIGTCVGGAPGRIRTLIQTKYILIYTIILFTNIFLHL